MIEVSTDGIIKTRLGSVAMGLGWTTVAVNAVVLMGTLLMILSIKVLAQSAE